MLKYQISDIIYPKIHLPNRFSKVPNKSLYKTTHLSENSVSVSDPSLLGLFCNILCKKIHLSEILNSRILFSEHLSINSDKMNNKQFILKKLYCGGGTRLHSLYQIKNYLNSEGDFPTLCVVQCLCSLEPLQWIFRYPKIHYLDKIYKVPRGSDK